MPTKTVKVPKQLHRAATIDLGSFDADKGTLRMSISSDVPYLRYDFWNDEEYYEVLDHSPGGVDESRLKAGLPILYNHNRDDHLGRAPSYVNDGHKITVESKFSESDFAQEKLRDAQAGVLPDTSVGYQIIEEDGECIGAKDGIPIYRFKWMPYEASLVTVPADISVGVGRQRDHAHKPKGEPVEITVAVDTSEEEKRSQSAPPNPTPPTMTDEEKQQKEAAEKREREQAAQRDQERSKEIRAQLLKDQNEINEIGKRFAPFGGEDKAKDAIKRGITPAEFQKELVDSFDPEAVRTAPSEGQRGTGEGRIQVIGERALSVGAQFVRSKEFQERGRRTGQRRSVAMDFPDVTMLGARGKASLAQRAGFTSGDLAAINIQVLPGMVELGMQKLTIMDLLTGGTTGAAALPYPKENGFGTIDGQAFAAGTYPRAKTVGEGQLKPNWDPDLTTDIANVKKVAVTTKVPDEFMADFPAAQSYIDGRLPYMVDLETEFQLLYGDGLNNNIKGIFSTQGIQTRAIDATSDTTVAASLKKGLTDVGVGSQFEPTGYAFHPYDWETASLLKDTSGRFLAGGPFYIPYNNGVYVEMHTFWGKPVVVSTSVTYGRPLTGSWKLGAQYFIREGMRLEMTNANEDDFRRNLIAVRAEHRLALACYRPVAFLEYTGFPART